MKRAAQLLKRSFEKSRSDNTPLLAAALAFYTLLSLAPAGWIVVALTGIILGEESARAETIAAVEEAVGPRGAALVGDVIERIEGSSSIATVIGAISMFFGATIAFAALQDSLNIIWADEKRQRGIVTGFVAKRLLSFGVFLLLGTLMIASVLAGAFVAGVSRFVPDFLPAPELLFQTADLAVSFGLMTALFAVMFRILPDAPVRWRDAWVGAAFTAVLFALGKTLISLYLGNTTTGSAYGAAGSLVVFLVWVYYSAQIFLFGAEFTEVYASRNKRRAA